MAREKGIVRQVAFKFRFFVKEIIGSSNFVVTIVFLITAFSFLLHIFNLNSSIDSDEYFYKTAALTIINHTSCGPLIDLVSLQPCNLEHPPFAKLLMASSIELFGQNNFGVRLPSVISGVLSIPTVAWLAWSLSGGNSKATIASTVLIATSPTWFLLSSVGMLDSVELFFGILALAFYFSKVGSEKLRLIVSGMLMGLSILSKEEAVLLLVGLLTYELLFGKPLKLIYLFASTITTFLAALWAFDIIYTSFINPFQQILFIIETGLRLRYQGGFLVSPLEWFFQPREIVLASLSFVWIPVALVLFIRKPRIVDSKNEHALLYFSFILFVVTLVPQLFLYYIDHRQEYLFYELQLIPALVVGSSGLLATRRVPWFVFTLVCLISTFLFAFYFSSLRSVYF